MSTADLRPLIIPNQNLVSMKEHALTEYPNECCGLLVGKYKQTEIEVTKNILSANVTIYDKKENFELDPQVRFEVMRELKYKSNLAIVGHYHSHPSHPAVPSDKDREMAFEPDLIWVIISVNADYVFNSCAFRFNTKTQIFDSVPIKTQ